MQNEAVDITPANGKNFFWGNKNAKIDEIENDYSLKKVKVKGIFDHKKEIQVEKAKNGEKGAMVVTPFNTHLNDKGEECGILVNRGWLPEDLKELRMHYTNDSMGEITGLLYKGENKHKYSQPNNPTADIYTRVDPYDLSLIMRMNNVEESSKFML